MIIGLEKFKSILFNSLVTNPDAYKKRYLKKSFWKKHIKYEKCAGDIIEMIKCLEFMYPEKWSITPSYARNLDNKRVDDGVVVTWHGVSPYYETGNDWFMESIEVMIHFPKFTVTNTRQQKTELTDMYIVLTFDSSDKRLTIYNIEGIRSSFTLKEASRGFHHPHLSSFYPNFSDGSNSFELPRAKRSFCLGSSELSISMSQFNGIMNDDDTTLFPEMQFEAFLASLLSYLKWESIEGVPYGRFSGVRYIGSENTDVIGSTTLKQAMNSAGDDLEKYIIIKDGSPRLLISHAFKKMLVEHISAQYHTISSFSNEDLVIVNGSKVLVLRDKLIEGLRNRNNPLFYFRGKPVYLNITDMDIVIPPTLEDSSTEDMVPSKKFLLSFKKYVEHELQRKYILEKYKQKRGEESLLSY